MGGFVSTGNAPVDQNFETANRRLEGLEAAMLKVHAQVEALTRTINEEQSRLENARKKYTAAFPPLQPQGPPLAKTAVMPRGWNVPEELKHMMLHSATGAPGFSSLAK